MAWKRVRVRNATERALYCLPILFFIFFTFSTLKGRVQPQWLIVASLGLIYILFYYTREYASRKLRRYIIAVGWITISLTVLARIELIWNPLGIRFEVFDNRPSFETIADVAGERPVIFGGSYAIASKYNFYTERLPIANLTFSIAPVNGNSETMIQKPQEKMFFGEYL